MSPLHIQASITASSEALYLLLMVDLPGTAAGGARRRSRPATFAFAGLLASLAAVTRYDAWIDFPLVAAGRVVLVGAPPAGAGDAGAGWLLFAAATALLPLAWIAWSARATDDPFFFAHYISNDHAHLAAAVTARWGPLGARPARLGIWSLAFRRDDEPAAACGRGDRAPALVAARWATAVGRRPRS